MKRAIVVFVLACVAYLAVRGLTHRSIEEIPFTPAAETVIREAQAQGHLVLLLFTGSDWSDLSRQLQADVLGTAEFADYAANRLVVLRIDLPRQSRLTTAEEVQNRALMKRFDVTGFPTAIILDRTGRALGRIGPKVSGSAAAYIAEIERIVQS